MPMQKVCPRCGATFECMHDNISQCHCASVQLTSDQRIYLKENFSDCICPHCLDEVSHSFSNSKIYPLYIKEEENDKESIDSQQR